MEKVILYPVFFTATIRGWKHLLKPEKYKIIVLNNLKELVEEKKVYLYAYCIMNNHIHLIWQMIGENNPSEVQKSLLENISKQIKNDLSIHHLNVLKIFESTQKDRSYHFWKRRPLSIELFSPQVFDQKLDYIHSNPVNAGLCEYPEQYKYSSARFYYDGIDNWNMLSHCDGI
jgi:REP element-mobilizing transposase RayT